MDILNDITKMIEDSSNPSNDITALEVHIEKLRKLWTAKSMDVKFKAVTDMLQELGFSEVHFGNWNKPLNDDLSIYVTFGPYQRVMVAVYIGDWIFSQDAFASNEPEVIRNFINDIKIPQKSTYSVSLSGDFYCEAHFRDWAHEQFDDEKFEVNVSH